MAHETERQADAAVVDRSVVSATELPGWAELAVSAGSPFLTAEWLQAWTAARGREARAVVRLADGAVQAAAVVLPVRGGWASAADDHTGSWAVLGTTAAARQQVWEQLASRSRRLVLDALPGPAADEAADVLRRGGWRVVRREADGGPRLVLPSCPDDVLGDVSKGLRSQYRRRLRDLRQAGRVELRTSADPDDLSALLRLEAAGWKGRAGTAVLCDPSTTRLYSSYATAAASSGHLRLQLLEVGGELVAGDLSIGFAGAVHMLKTTYDERWRACSPGLVLRGHALESAVLDGYRVYDTLGGADDYKLRWGGTPVRVAALRAYRGAGSSVAHAFQLKVRPLLAAGRHALRAEARAAG